MELLEVLITLPLRKQPVPAGALRNWVYQQLLILLNQ
jgi:hypothetical protein